MGSLPQTYQIVRQGAVTAVTVRSDEEVVLLRTELELLSSFAKGATHEFVEALNARLAVLKSEGAETQRPDAEDVEDMLGILRDAMDPVTAAAIARIDTDFPKASGEVDMASVEKESGQFHEDAGKQVEASGKPASGKLSQAFKQALLKTALAARQDAGKAATAAGPVAAEATAASPADPSPGQQPPSAGTTPVEQAEAAPEVSESDPVEAALKEAVGVAEESLAVEGGEAMGLEDDLDGEEGLSVEELETQETLEIDEAMEVDETLEIASSGGPAAGSVGQDPVEAALAEAVEQAAEHDGQTGDTAGAALPGSVEVVSTSDPVEAIMAEQEAGGMPVDALEQIVAEQEASPAGENSVEQPGQTLPAEQTDSPPAARAADGTTGKERPQQAGDRTRRGKANANQSTLVMSQNDESSPDVAAEEVAEILQAGRDEIDAITSAFQEAASSLDRIESDVSSLPLETGDSVLPASDPVDATCVRDLKEQVDMPIKEENPGSVTGSADTTSPGGSLPGFKMREELQTVRQTVQTGLDTLLRLLDRVDQTYIEAENRLAQARTFRQAAQRAQEVSEKLVQAQTETAEARAVYESARQRLDEAQSAWEDARRAADNAAL